MKQHPRNLVLELTPAQAFAIRAALGVFEADAAERGAATPMIEQIQNSDAVATIDRAELTLRAENAKAPLRHGICRYCGCTDKHACIFQTATGPVCCSWADKDRTVCNHPLCVLFWKNSKAT